MTNPPAPTTLDDALKRVARAFRGMTARADEMNCECHWGSAEELASLKVPDVELEPDLLRRTWQAPDWSDHAAILRRIMPQLTAALANGAVSDYDLRDLGYSFSRGNWQQWPAEQAEAVLGFLQAWWAHCLTAATAPAPAHEALALCVEASGSAGPWLASWESIRHPMADQRLAETIAQWDFDLLQDDMFWWTMDDQEGKRQELTTWLLRHAPSRIGDHGDPAHLRNVLRLLAIPGLARYDDPHWPFPAVRIDG
ncbi:hypothetical protein ACFCV3_07700 [Kribbella sp. NPDC056345]|uniref:hypothetical protein n=1 Tax=Kribbella sp. NPDC056345 TaxID=3345789 RepID=UPI0035DC488D